MPQPRRKKASAPSKAASQSQQKPSPSDLIDERIEQLGDWRGKALARVRKLIKQADPDVVEEWKWRGVPVWSHDGIICTGETYKAAVKLTFHKGAALDDPAGLFNASLDGNARRAIDIHEGDSIDEKAFKALIGAAVKLNTSKAKPTKGKPKQEVRLLSGGNPQIAKADGDAPVQAYIAAMPGWKRDLGKQLDALIVRTVPKVRKAVKWNSPLYGIEGNGWFLGVHTFNNYVKVAFFRGADLRPVPPDPSKDKNTRYVNIREGQLDEKQMAAWVKQAAALPGWVP
ncbi:MAG: DUF1801 domain-containing protein [Gemmatimonadales bacterium]